MFSVFEDLILKVEIILNNAEFISENYELIMRSLDRVNIILEEYTYLKTKSILEYNLYGGIDVKDMGFI